MTLLKWIEQNLDSPLSMEMICQKSGYSERHLQRIFKEETGETLANYIIQRRLYKIAIALKTTLTPIDKLARRYQFKTIASFSRAFFRVFGVTPKQFRGENKTNLSMLPNILDFTNPNVPKLDISYVYFDGLELFGLTDKYSILPEDLDKYHILNRSPLEERFSRLTQGGYSEVYGLAQYACNSENPDYIEVDYSIGVNDKKLRDNPALSPLPLVFGDYIMAACKNISVPFFDVCEKAYWEIILKTGITRRRGREIERIVWKDNIRGKKEIDYYFMIPIVFDDKVYDFLSPSDQT